MFDRLFGLASLTLENASELGINRTQGQIKLRAQERTETVGFSGNNVSIPSLKKQNAEALKGIVLQKIKENPIEDSQSGL